jgi:hypothetical protein
VRLLILRLFGLAAATITGCSAAHSGRLDAETMAAYADLSLVLPSPSLVVVCHGFGCRLHTEIGLTAADRARLTQILHAGKASAAAERTAIAAAVAWFDRRVGPEAGTAHHVARGGHDQMGDAASQFDCIDASRNTTSLLLVLDELHLLKYHRVEQTVARGAFIDGRWPHATAVVAELASDREWAVDSWTHAAGEKPDVKPLQVWLKEGGL